MRRAYHDRFHSNIEVKGDMVVEIKPTKDYSVDAIINADSDYSQWSDRDSMWMSRK